MAADKAKQKANPTHKPPNPHPTKPQMASWADRVKVTDSSTRFTLDPITKTDDGDFFDIMTDMLTDDAEQWNRCMVGFFPGFRMNYHTVNAVAHRVWKAGGLESVMSTANCFWLFRFNTEDSMHAILERGPWMFGGKTMIYNSGIPNSFLIKTASPSYQSGSVFMAYLSPYGLGRDSVLSLVGLEGLCLVTNKPFAAQGLIMQGSV